MVSVYDQNYQPTKLFDHDNAKIYYFRTRINFNSIR